MNLFLITHYLLAFALFLKNFKFAPHQFNLFYNFGHFTYTLGCLDCVFYRHILNLLNDVQLLLRYSRP